MRLDRLTVRNFKGFAEQSFSFNPNFNVLVGPNGAGKTSALDACAAALYRWVSLFAKHRKGDPLPGSVRIEAFGKDASIFFEAQFPVEVEAEGHYDGDPIRWSRRLDHASAVVSNPLNDLHRIVYEVRGGLGSDPARTLPVIAYYTSERGSQLKANISPIRGETRLPEREELSRSGAYADAFNARIDVKPLRDLMVQDRLYRSSERGGWGLGDAVRSAVLGCIPGATWFDISPETLDLAVEIEGRRLPFEKLSDGQRTMLALVGDLARRVARLNPHLGELASVETSGVVLIDELDLHLHPRWQREIVGNLKRTFPKVQFITTTHSPQIVGQVPARQILLLTPNGSPHPTATFGLESNDALEDVLGASASDPKVARLTEAIESALSELDVAKAERMLEELRLLAEQPNPQTMVLEVKLDNVRALLEDAESSIELEPARSTTGLSGS